MSTRVNYGPWLVNPDTLVLVWPENYDYEVDLEDCRSPQQVRAWIEHLKEKPTVDGWTLTGLRNGLRDILGSDINIGSTDSGPEISTERLKELVDDAVRRGAPVDSHQDETAVTATPIGANAAQSITYNSTVINGSVANLHSGSGNLIVGYDASSATRLVDQLRAALPTLAFDGGDGQDVAQALQDLDEVGDPGRAAVLIHKLQEVLGRAKGPLQPIVVGLIDAELRKLAGLPPG